MSRETSINLKDILESEIHFAIGLSNHLDEIRKEEQEEEKKQMEESRNSSSYSLPSFNYPSIPKI